MEGYLSMLSGLQNQLSVMNKNVQGLITSTSRLIPIAHREKRQSPPPSSLAAAIESLRNQLITVTNQLRSITAQNREGDGGSIRQAGTSARPTRRTTTTADFEDFDDDDDYDVTTTRRPAPPARTTARPQPTTTTAAPTSTRRRSTTGSPGTRSTTTKPTPTVAIDDYEDYDDYEAPRGGEDTNGGSGSGSVPSGGMPDTGNIPGGDGVGGIPSGSGDTNIDPQEINSIVGQGGQAAGNIGSVIGASQERDNQIERILRPLQQSLNELLTAMNRIAGGDLTPLG